jgi:hypothetical protein
MGKEMVSRGILVDLIERSKRMPQVSEGWQTKRRYSGRGTRSPGLKRRSWRSTGNLMKPPGNYEK